MTLRRSLPAFFALYFGLTAVHGAATQDFNPDAAEVLLRYALEHQKFDSDICVTVDGHPLPKDVTKRLIASEIKIAAGDTADCTFEIGLGQFLPRPELGTYEMRFWSQIFGGSNVAVMKHFPDGWHVITTYHVGVWL